jgi:protein-tyrosine-phosphatase
MAEIIARNIFNEDNLDIKLSSAGIYVLPNSFINYKSILALEKFDDVILLDSDKKYKSRQITQEEIINNDFIFTMSSQQAKILKDNFCNIDSQKKIFTLSEFACKENYDITDPIGGDLKVYQKCAEEIFSLVNIIEENFKQSYFSRF